MRSLLRIPAWVWIASLALGATQPLIGLYLAYGLPEGYVATGMHIPDSSLFLQSMRMFFNGFHSQFVTCLAPGDSGIQYYPLPHLWLYGLLGVAARALHMSDFAAYFLANGLGGAIYLLTVYFLLRELVPDNWKLSFLLFVGSGGLGGVFYLASWLARLHAAPAFEDYFWRFALYDLFEGAHLHPILYFPRLYYTLSLALCLGALTLVIRARNTGRPALLLWAGALFMPGMFINTRYGMFTLGLTFLYLWQDWQRQSEIGPVRAFLHILVPGAVGGAIAWLLMGTNRAAVYNHVEVANTAMWFTPFLSVVALHLFVAPGAVYRSAVALPRLERSLAFGAMGYLGAFGLFFALYQMYWGNILVARDAAAALAVSDPAFIGATGGLIMGFRRRDELGETKRDFLVLWMLSFLVLSLTAFGRGWWLNFGPQRLQIFLWLPICIFSAEGLKRLWARHPARARALAAGFGLCGAATVLAAAFFFQGAWGLVNSQSRLPYAHYHADAMTQNDSDAIAALGKGRVLAPNLAADAVALRRDNPVVFGTGSFNMTDQPYAAMEAEVLQFFAAGTDAAWREDFLRRWCVDWVYCPETWPVDVRAVEEIAAIPLLQEEGRFGNAVVFRVTRGE